MLHGPVGDVIRSGGPLPPKITGADTIFKKKVWSFFSHDCCADDSLYKDTVLLPCRRVQNMLYCTVAKSATMFGDKTIKVTCVL